jgi:hypothetical protein
VFDPLTALLIPADGGDGPSEAACRRTLSVFDGRRRFDLKLAFKRMDKVKADKGYAGPAVVCAVAFQPVAGHRSSSIAGTRLLAPFRMSIANMLGDLVVQANRFEVLAPDSMRASATTGQAQ